MFMKFIIWTIAIGIMFLNLACGEKVPIPDVPPPNTSQPAIPTAQPTPIPTPVVPKNGDYPGHGKVTKINNQLGSVELNHEEIVGVMPAMKMEFYVSDKSLLKGLTVGDAVTFSLRYKDGQETIVAISKAK